MRMKIGLAILTMVWMGGCAETAHLYPANDIAAATGVLEARFVANGTGHTTVQATMPDGEILNGEATIVSSGSVGFGSILASVGGTGGSAFGSGTSAALNVSTNNPGVASLFGTKGTYMQCEYYNDGLTGHGYGACRSSKGALYRLQY